MTIVTANAVPDKRTATLESRYIAVRQRSLDLCQNLAPEDMTVQSMPDASPTKWHLAHVTWFFENFVLQPHLKNYRVFREEFGFLFNSYYYSVGSMYARPQRGLITRPGIKEIFDYRKYVDDAISQLLQHELDSEVEFLVTLGLQHEQQHQELMLTDLKHLLFQNPMQPAYHQPLSPETVPGYRSLDWIFGEEGIHEVGHEGAEFCFDNETPRHRALLQPFAIADRLVTNSEYKAFVMEGGYRNSELWLSDGWARINSDNWQHPFYWHSDLEREFTLSGLVEINPHAPVSHLSFYEADAFSRWAGCRLPTEFEWEVLAAKQSIEGNFAETELLHPTPASTHSTQFFGDVWEWTMSPYTPYPGFQPLAGSLGEYNGKFMSSQMILRGGSCVTPLTHIRPSYRNFFYPDARWQFSGVRLAKDLL